MTQEPNPQDRLLELIFGLLPEDEADELRAEIEKDGVLAKAFAEAQATAQLMGEAARLQSPRIPLIRPEPNGRPVAGPASVVSGPESAPWSGWAQWGLMTAASLLVLAAFVGWTRHRSHLVGAGVNHLRLQVTGPSELQESIDNRYTITTTTLTGRPLSANVHFAAYSAEGTKLLGHTEKTGNDGTLRVDIPADPELPDTVRIEVEAGEEQSRQTAESRLPVRREKITTHLRLDRSRYAPGQTVHYRSVSLSRFHLDPERPLPVEYEILGPQETVLEGSHHQAVTERGVAFGAYAIPRDASAGIYTLRVSSPDPRFAEAHRRFCVPDNRQKEFQFELEFAGSHFGPGMDVTAAFRVTRRDGTPTSGAKLQLAAKAGEETIYEDSTTTDSDGAAAVSFHLPEQLDSQEAVLIVTVDDGAVQETLLEPIPLGSGKIAVDFFPEGGDLAAVGENRVYFAARDADDEPVELKGWIVDQDGRTVAAIETVHEGRGMFRFSPRVAVRYRLVAESPTDADVDGQLPFVMPTQKIVLNAGAGVFDPGEPLEFNVRASLSNLPLVAMASCRGVHVGERAFLTKSSSTENGNNKAVANAVAISLPDSAVGVIRLTVFDYSVTPPLPVAERLVYRKPPKRLHVALAADRDSYEPGATCRLGVSVSDEKGRPVESLLGLSVVDEAVLDSSTSGPTSMTTYFWLTSEIKHPHELENANFLLKNEPEAEVALDLLLGTQGWRRFAERSLARGRDVDSEAGQLGQMVAIGAETAPPLMLDNLSSLTASTDLACRNIRGSRGGGHLLGALIVLAGSGLLVFVTMLSLLRIAGGMRLWAPATIAVGVSFFLVFLMMSPDRPTSRAVAFLSYCPAETTETAGLVRAADSFQEPQDKARASDEATELFMSVEQVGEAESPKAATGMEVDTEEEGIDRPEDMRLEETDLGRDAKTTPLPKLPPEATPPTRGSLAKQPALASTAGQKQDLRSAMVERTLFREYNLAFDPHAVRRDFAKTVLWAPLLETDAKGKVEASFELSDSVTRYRAVADGYGAGRIGSVVETIAAELPFHLSPQVPEEVTLGDRIDIPLVITSGSSERQEVQISIEAAEQIQLAGSTKFISEPDGETRRLVSTIATGLSDRAELVFRGTSGRHADAVERTLRIEPPGYPQTHSISGVLETKQELAVEIPDDVVPDSIHASVTLFPSTLADLQSGLQAIAGNRFESAVATVAVSDLLVDYLKQNKIADPEALRLLKKRRSDALRTLSIFRNSEGGYSHTEDGPAEIGPTSAALLALSTDRDSFGGDSVQTARTAQWLHEQFDSQEDEKAAANEASARAWGLWALAVSGQTDLDSMLELVATTAVETGNAEQLALAALSANRLDQGVSGNDLLEHLMKLQADTGRVGGPDASDVETTALATMAWLDQSASSGSPAEEAVTWLWSRRDGSGGFGSPRATALVLHALITWGKHDRRDVPASKVVVRRGEDLLAEQEIKPNCQRAIVLNEFGEDLSAGNNTLSLNLTEGDQLPFALTVRYRRHEQPAPPEAGALELHTELEKSKVGEGQTVQLSVRLKSISELTVTSPVAEIGLPAGLEIAPSLLEAEKKAGRITAYETRPRRIILFLQDLKPGDQADFALDATTVVPGNFTGPASFAYLPQDSNARYWSEPLTVVVPGAEQRVASP